MTAGEPARPAFPLRGHGADIALLTAIDPALDVPRAELPARVALVRGYLRYVLDAIPGTHRTASFQVIAGMIARDANLDQQAGQF